MQVAGGRGGGGGERWLIRAQQPRRKRIFCKGQAAGSRSHPAPHAWHDDLCGFLKLCFNFQRRVTPCGRWGRAKTSVHPCLWTVPRAQPGARPSFIRGRAWLGDLCGWPNYEPNHFQIGWGGPSTGPSLLFGAACSRGGSVSAV